MAQRSTARPEWLTYSAEDLTTATLHEMWHKYYMTVPYSWGILESFRVIIRDHLRIETFSCRECGLPALETDKHSVSGDLVVCGPCFDECMQCDMCGDHALSTTSIAGHGDVCAYCLDDHFVYCDECSEYVDKEHDTSHTCDCESPQMTFSIRNDGKAPLSNDERITMELPAGLIDETGLMYIKRALSHYDDGLNTNGHGRILYDYRMIPYELDPKWQTKQGNFTKRLSSAVYKASGKTVSIPKELLAEIGVMARNHSSNSASVHIEITRNLNLSAREFAHGGSCWWESYSASRCALKSNGGFGIRSFNQFEALNSTVKGRAWVMPLKMNDNAVLSPTFDSLNADAYVVFNGYYELDGYTPARILAHMVGMSYKKIEFEAEPMYINAGGYLVAPQDILENHSSINRSLDQHSTLYHRESQELVNA